MRRRRTLGAEGGAKNDADDDEGAVGVSESHDGDVDGLELVSERSGVAVRM